MIVGSSKVFEFTGVEFDKKNLTAELKYTCGEHSFCERITFDVDDPQNLDTEGLERALKLMHLVCGVSYYKAFVGDVKELRVSYPIPDQVASFLNHIYEEGLGEFYYHNNLPPSLTARFEGSGEKAKVAEDTATSGYCVGLGGGKDSLVAAALLETLGESPIYTYGINANELLVKQSGLLGTSHLDIKRMFDIEAMRALVSEGGDVPNGHIPISAILGSIGLVGSMLIGTSTVVVAVERSANEPTREYQGKMINHQYSKTTDFEKSFDKVITSWISESCGYFSILRPLRELDIMKLFFALGLEEKFEGAYTSCNKSLNFTIGRKEDDALWCGRCDKCAFIFLLMTGAGKYYYAVNLFGRDLLADEDLRSTYDALLGNTDSKPFDCVGELDESRESMDVAKQVSSAAATFTYIPADQNSELWGANNIPEQLADRLRALVTSLLIPGSK